MFVKCEQLINCDIVSTFMLLMKVAWFQTEAAPTLTANYEACQPTVPVASDKVIL